MAQPWTERFAHVDIAPAGIMTAWFNDLRLSDDDVRKARRWLVATAILALLGGAAAMVVPPIATLTTTLFIGLPRSAEWAIGLLVGVNLIFWGTRALAAASLLKRVFER